MMTEVERYSELLERRLVTLRLLAVDLEESRKAFVDLDLPAIHRHISQQERLCTEIRLLDAELKDELQKPPCKGAPAENLSLPAKLDVQVNPDSARQLQLLLGGLKAIQADVRRLSRVHSELLRRSRRSVNVLLNFLAHYSGTYPTHMVRPPGLPLTSTVTSSHVQSIR